MDDDLGVPCTVCYQRSAAGMRFCTSCGTPLPEVEPPRPLFVDDTLISAVPVGTCRSCGAVVADGLRFCTGCGAPVGTAPAAPLASLHSPPPPPPPPSPLLPPPLSALAPPLTGPPPPLGGPPRPARRSGRVVLVLAVVLLLVGGGVGAWALTRDDDSSQPAAAPPVTDPPADGGDLPSEGTSTDVVPSPSAVAPAVPPVTCWDGSTTERVANCSVPQGRAGLRYVFPGMRGQECSRLGASPTIDRTALVQCVAYLDDGTAIKINYSQWGSVASANDHYSGKLDSARGPRGLQRWIGQVRGQYNGAQVYRDEPFSTSTYAPTEAALLEALGSVAQGRQPESIRGRPTP